MVKKGIPLTGSYLESLPPNKIAKYSDNLPKNGIPFTGYPQQHPTDKSKLILIYDPLGKNPTVMEFKLDDILSVEEVAQAVTKKGEGVPMIKLWMRKGAHGMILEPFEVDGTVHFLEVRREFKERFSKKT